MIKVTIRPSEQLKVPHYKKRLKKALVKSKKIGLELALKEWAEEITTL